jgi:hypothetical protein
MSQAQLLLFGDFTIESSPPGSPEPKRGTYIVMLSSDNIVVQQLMDDGTWLDRDRLTMAKADLQREVLEYGAYPDACLAHDTRDALKLVRERLQQL